MPQPTRSVPAGYLNETQLASQLAVAVRTVRAWRYQGKGPPVTWLGLGRRPAYRIEAVQDWMQSREEAMPRERTNRQIAKEYRAT
jgi:phage terminase Nu1 subunit (DNA packaging protein)